VLAEPVLTERQKQVLLEIYDSFRKEAAAQAAEALAEPGDDVPVAGLLAATSSTEPAAGLREEEDDDPLAAPEPPRTRRGVPGQGVRVRVNRPAPSGGPGEVETP
jgi:hypothetical protein